MHSLRSVLGGLKRANLEPLLTLAYAVRDPHRVVVTGLALVAVFLLALLDVASGPGVGFAVFYALAVTGATFHAGWVSGAIVAISASGAGFLARLLYLSGEVSVAAALWNLGNEMAVFIALVLITHHGRTLLDRLAAQSRLDLLTGALNTRGIIEAYDVERARAIRHAVPLSVAFIDLDDMKRVNDELGHGEGDEMLRTLAASVMSSIRETDIFGRVGGDEFALVLPDTDEHEALRAIQRLRRVVNRRSRPEGPYISVSVGVVTFRRTPPSADDALKAADSLMYMAKRAGGNRVAGSVLAWDAEPLAEFGLVFDLAEHQAARRRAGDDDDRASA